MKEYIVDLLKASSADGWSVKETVSEGWEFYFIRHKLDQNRIRRTSHITLTVYRKFEEGKFLGSASAELAPTADEEETKALIDSLTAEALLVKNPYFELVKPSGASKTPDAAAPEDVSDIARAFIEVMNDLPETDTEDINSYEIFADTVTEHLVTSTGIDVCYSYPSSMLEVVVNARKEDHEIELYRMYLSGTCDKATLKEEITETMTYGRDKLSAKKTPALGKADLVLSTDAALQVYQYFIYRMSSILKFQRISNWEPGKPVAEGATGDLVTVQALKFLENSSKNQPYDEDGAPRRDLTIIRDGVAENFFGPKQFNDYLGLKDSFRAANFEVSGGTKTAEDIRKGSYIEVVEFSDFQVSAFNGDIFGEIRLGYLHDGDTVTIIEGGSVSGTMADFAKTLEMSKEQKQYNSMLIPAVTKLKDVNITGAE